METTTTTTVDSQGRVMDHLCRDCANRALDNKSFKYACMAYIKNNDHLIHPLCDEIRRYSKCAKYEETGEKPKESDFLKGIALGASLMLLIIMIGIFLK